MSPMPGRHLAALLVGLLLGTSACTADQPVAHTRPGPTGEPATTVSSTTSPPPSSPPPITRPLDASAYKGERACELIAQAQVEAYDLVPRPESTIVEDPYRAACKWDSKDTKFSIALSFYYGSDHFGRIYRREHEYWLTDGGFTQTTVAGQPAARKANPMDIHLCMLAVGITANQAIELHVLSYKGDGCQFGEMLAADIVHNLGG